MSKKRSKDSSHVRSSESEQGLSRLLHSIQPKEPSGENLSTSDLPIFERLSSYSRGSFKKLCDLGCDQGILSDYFDLLPQRKLLPKTITSRQVGQIAKRAKKVLADIGDLEKLYIMDVMFPLPVDEHIPHSEVPYAIRVLQEMAELPKFLKEVWPVWNPEYVNYLSVIYNHIHTETKHWNDALVADILNDLFPHPEDPIFNEESLKIWRNRHGLTDKTTAK